MFWKKVLNVIFCSAIVLFSRIPCFAYLDKDFQKIEKDFAAKPIAKGDFSKKDNDGKVIYLAKVSNKLLNGNVILNYSNSSIKKKSTFKKGQLDGFLESFDKKGKLKEKLSLKQGILNGKSQFFQDGVIKQEFNFRNDLKHGPYKLFNKKGIEIENGSFQNGELLKKQLTKFGQEEKAKRQSLFKKISIGIVSALLITGLAFAAANSRGGGGGSSYSPSSGYQYNGFRCNQSLQGCCSYHHGILAAGYTPEGTVIPVTVGNRVVCNDRQYSPSCYCYAN
jgi:hypothetical protein